MSAGKAMFFKDLAVGVLFSYNHGPHAMILQKTSPEFARIVKGRRGSAVVAMHADIPVKGDRVTVPRSADDLKELT